MSVHAQEQAQEGLERLRLEYAIPEDEPLPQNIVLRLQRIRGSADEDEGQRLWLRLVTAYEMQLLAGGYLPVNSQNPDQARRALQQKLRSLRGLVQMLEGKSSTPTENLRRQQQRLLEVETQLEGLETAAPRVRTETVVEREWILG